jgi:hypothetical protein
MACLTHNAILGMVACAPEWFTAGTPSDRAHDAAADRFISPALRDRLEEFCASAWALAALISNWFRSYLQNLALCGEQKNSARSPEILKKC